MEARLESARRASEVHKKRTGKYLVITEDAVVNEEMYEEEGDNALAALRRLGVFYSGLASFDKLRDHVGAQIGIRESFMQHQQKMQQHQQLSDAKFDSTRQPTMYAHNMLSQTSSKHQTPQQHQQSTGQPNRQVAQQPNQQVQASVNMPQRQYNSIRGVGPDPHSYASTTGMMPPNPAHPGMSTPSSGVQNNNQPGLEAAQSPQRHSTSSSPSLPPTPGSHAMMQPSNTLPQGYYQLAYGPLRLSQHDTEGFASNVNSARFKSSSVTSARVSKQLDESPVRSPSALPRMQEYPSIQQTQDYKQTNSRHPHHRRSRSPQTDARAEYSNCRQRDYHQRNSGGNPGFNPATVPVTLGDRTSTVSEENIPVQSIESNTEVGTISSLAIPKDVNAGLQAETAAVSNQIHATDLAGFSAQAMESASRRNPISLALPPELQQMVGSLFDSNDPTTAALMQGSQNYPQPQIGHDVYYADKDSKAARPLDKATINQTASILDTKPTVTMLSGNAWDLGKNNETLEWPFDFPEFGQEPCFDTAYPELNNEPITGNFEDSMFDMINFDAF
jgi:hypothetical protein